MSVSLEEHVAELFGHPSPTWRMAAAMALAVFAAAHDHLLGITFGGGVVSIHRGQSGMVPEGYKGVYLDSYNDALKRLEGAR